MITVTQKTINSRAITIKVTPENVALGFSLQAKQYRDEAEVFKDTCEGVQVVLQDLIDNLSEVLEVQTELPEILELHSKLTELLAIFNKLSTLDSVYASLTEIEAVSAKLVEITTLYTNIASIQNVNDNIASIVTVASDITVINSIYDNLTKIDTLYTNILAIISLYTNIGVLQTLNSNITELQGIYTELTKLVSVYTNLASILAVEAKLTEISAVYAKLTQITAIYNSLTQLQTLYTNLSALLNVEADLTNINIVATDIAKVIIAANNIDNINTNAVNIQAIIDAPAFAQLAEDYANKAEDSEVETGKYSSLHWAAKSEGFADDSEIAKVASQTAQGLSEDARDLSEKWAEETEDVEVEAGKYSAKHYSLKAEASKIATAASAAQAETLANSISLGGIFWPETEALRTRVIADEGTFIKPMRLIDPQMDDVQGVNTSLLTNMAAYKTGKLYSIRPDDGSGDFTCVRATTPTRINQLGESEVVPVNTPVIDWSTGSPLLIVTVEGELTLPSTGYDAVKTIILDDVGYTFPNKKDYNSFRLPVGSYRRVIASNAELSVLQITALGATTVYEDALVLPISGNPLNPASPTNGTIVFSATSDVDVVATGDVVIVSTTRAADSTFRSHNVVISCANGKSGTIVVKQASKIVSLGNHNGDSNPSINFYTGANGTAPELTWNLNDAPVNCQKIRQANEYLNILPTNGNRAMPVGLTFLYLSGANINWTYSGAMPVGLTLLELSGANINWTYSGAMPVGLYYLLLYGNNINWTYSGAMPVGLTFLLLYGNNINWTYSGAMPVGLTFLYLSGANINWTYSGAMPVGLYYLLLSGANINWTYSGAMPVGLTLLRLYGNNINWTGAVFGNPSTPKPNMINITLSNYRNPSDTMDYTQLLSMLNSLINNVGTLPTTVIISEQIPVNVTAIAAASPNETGTDAEKCKYYINFIKSTKSVTTFTLNTIGI